MSKPAEKALFFARDDLFQGTLLHAAVHGAVGFSAQAMDGAFLEKTKDYQKTIQFLTELEETQYRENLMQPYLLQPYLLGKLDSRKSNLSDEWKDLPKELSNRTVSP